MLLIVGVAGQGWHLWLLPINYSLLGVKPEPHQRLRSSSDAQLSVTLWLLAPPPRCPSGHVLLGFAVTSGVSACGGSHLLLAWEALGAWGEQQSS